MSKTDKRKPLKPSHCPAHLTAAAREAWLDLVRDAPAGLLVSSDAATVTVFACAKALHDEAAARVSEYGALVQVGAKTEVNPWVAILNAQAGILSKAGRDLAIGTWRKRTRKTGEAAAAGETAKGPAIGKKEQAKAEAADAVKQPGHDWGDDLNPNLIN